MLDLVTEVTRKISFVCGLSPTAQLGPQWLSQSETSMFIYMSRLHRNENCRLEGLVYLGR